MWEPLCVDVQGKTIVVTMPGSDFAASYEKHPDQPDALCFHKRKKPGPMRTGLNRCPLDRWTATYTASWSAWRC